MDDEFDNAYECDSPVYECGNDDDDDDYLTSLIEYDDQQGLQLEPQLESKLIKKTPKRSRRKNMKKKRSGSTTTPTPKFARHPGFQKVIDATQKKKRNFEASIDAIDASLTAANLAQDPKRKRIEYDEDGKLVVYDNETDMVFDKGRIPVKYNAVHDHDDDHDNKSHLTTYHIRSPDGFEPSIEDILRERRKRYERSIDYVFDKYQGRTFDIEQHLQFTVNRFVPFPFHTGGNAQDLQQFYTLTTTLCCFWCTEPCNCVPLPMAHMHFASTNKFSVHGQFCSIHCLITYVRHHDMSKLPMNRLMLDKVYGIPRTATIPPAKHWKELRKFGGLYAIEDFRQAPRIGIQTKEIKFPMIPFDCGFEELEKFTLIIKESGKTQHEIFRTTESLRQFNQHRSRQQFVIPQKLRKGNNNTHKSRKTRKGRNKINKKDKAKVCYEPAVDPKHVASIEEQLEEVRTQRYRIQRNLMNSKVKSSSSSNLMTSSFSSSSSNTSNSPLSSNLPPGHPRNSLLKFMVPKKPKL